MEKGDNVSMRMLHQLDGARTLESKEHRCVIWRYDKEEGRIYMLLEKEELTAVSNDAVYVCRIHTKDKTLCLTGRVEQRYLCEAGRIIELQIANGVYEEE